MARIIIFQEALKWFGYILLEGGDVCMSNAKFLLLSPDFHGHLTALVPSLQLVKLHHHMHKE